jgi:Fe-S cluster assembly iron-binding protein IscA
MCGWKQIVRILGGHVQITDKARERLQAILAEHPGAGLRVTIAGHG